MQWGEWGAKALRFIARPIELDARITVLEGSVRSGKTVATIPKLLTYCARGPQGVIALTGYTKHNIRVNLLNDLFDAVGNDNYRYNKITGELMLYDRRLQVIGLKDSGSEKHLRGGTFAGAFCDELTTMPESSFTQLLNRLSVPGAKLYGTTNPDSPYHYLYTGYLTDPDKLAAGMVRRIHFELDDNPNLTDEYKTFIRSAYSGLWYQRMVLGRWVMAQGAIYDMYSAATHEITRDQLPPAFERRHIGIDYGAGNPTVFVKLGVTTRNDGKPIIWQYGEYYHDPAARGGKTNEQYKADLLRFMGKEYINGIYPDPSALAFIIELKSPSCGRAFTSVKRSNNDVLAGINSVATLMQDGRYKVVAEDCPETCKEHVSYIWDEHAQKRGEDAPVKEHDHCEDAVRYPIHTVYPAAKRGGTVWMAA